MYRYRDTEHIGITPVTETGGVVTIDNADDVILIQDLVADIEPIQDLHGYNAPWAGGAGKNKAEFANASNVQRNKYTYTSETAYSIKGTKTATGDSFFARFVASLKGGTAYTFSIQDYKVSETSTALHVYIYTDELLGTRVTYFSMNPSSRQAQFTPTSDGNYVIGLYNVGAVDTSFEAEGFMIRLASETDATYEPYENICPISGHTDVVVTVADDYDNPTVSDTYTTALGQTVYGGTLDVTTGVLTVTDGNIASYNGETLPSTWISDRDVYASGTAPTTGAQVVYKLATPQTYQLTAQQIITLLGQNNVWASSGNIKVVYAVDLKKYVTLPKEAVSINGTYIEKILDGYSTLYVKGRESLGVELNTYSVGTANGEKVKGKRYPARVLTVGFQLLADNEAEFRQRFNQLNNLLSLDEADFVFNDETDKYFTGYPVMDASIEAGRNNVTGEWQIYCAYPFKRSVEVKTLSSTDASGVVISGSSATFTFDYNGTQPARPILRAEFASAKEGGDFNEDGDCGFVAFLNTDEDIIQLGNPDVIDVDVLNKNGTLANSEFSTLTDWTASGISVGSITDTYWARGVGQTMNFARGTGTLSRSTTGAVGFEFDIVHRLAVSAPAEVGTFEAHLKNGANVIVGFEIEKTGNGTAGTVSYIINDKIVGTDSIDISYYNTSFGYCNRTPVYVQQSYQQQVITYVKQKKKKKKKKVVSYVTKTRTVQNGWNYTQSNLNSGISRDGGVVTFSVGNLPDRTFKDSDIDNTPVYDVVFTYTGNLHTNALRSASLIRKAGVPFAEIPNVFTAGDIVEADCNNANVYLYRDGSIEGHLEPQYGALGNDWEDFEIKVGQNIIRAVWSDWVDPNYKPVVKILFNEVYI